MICVFVQTVGWAGSQLEYNGISHRVVSFTDDEGFFSYSFYGTSNQQFRSSTVGIALDTALIESIESPTGWIASNSATYVSWSCTNEPAYSLLSSEPLTFVLRCSTNAFVVGSEGFDVGEASLDGTDWAVGYEDFEYMQPVPEPSVIALLGVASFVIGGTRRFVNKRFCG